MSQSANKDVRRRPSKSAAVLQLLAIAGGITLALFTQDLDRWHIGTLIAIVTFALVSELTPVKINERFYISGSFLGIILAVVVLGGGAGAAIGVLTIVVGWFRLRVAAHYFRNNVVNFLWFPLLTGLFFEGLKGLLNIQAHSLASYLLVFVAFVFGLGVNYVIAAGYQCWLDGSSFVEKTRHTLVPVLPAELFCGLLTLGAVFIVVHLGTLGLVLFGLVLVIYQYLVGELLISQRRSQALQRAATTDDLTGLANRESFRTAVEKRIAHATESGSPFPVMLMDLDRFKEINDTLGHHYGDVLLRDLGPRLVEAVGEGALVARLGGDEFGILLGEDIDEMPVIEVFLCAPGADRVRAIQRG